MLCNCSPETRALLDAFPSSLQNNASTEADTRMLTNAAVVASLQDCPSSKPVTLFRPCAGS
jgi:hypothetical protein